MAGAGIPEIQEIKRSSLDFISPFLAQAGIRFSNESYVPHRPKGIVKPTVITSEVVEHHQQHSNVRSIQSRTEFSGEISLHRRTNRGFHWKATIGPSWEPEQSEPASGPQNEYAYSKEGSLRRTSPQGETEREPPCSN